MLTIDYFNRLLQSIIEKLHLLSFGTLGGLQCFRHRKEIDTIILDLRIYISQNNSLFVPLSTAFVREFENWDKN